MRAFTAGTARILSVDNAEGVVHATMTPDSSALLASVCDAWLHDEKRGNETLRAHVECLRDGFVHGAEGDELLRHEPITRMAANRLKLDQDCVRELRGWTLHMRTMTRWPASFGEEGEDMVARALVGEGAIL